MKEIDWSEDLLSVHLERGYDYCLRRIKEVFELSNRSEWLRKRKENTLPWVNNEYRKLMKDKNHLLKKIIELIGWTHWSY